MLEASGRGPPLLTKPLARARELAAAHEKGLRAKPGRRALGQYFTPDELVRFLVVRVLDPLIERARRARDPVEAILGLRILDPACGAGAFLIGAFEHLLSALRELDGDVETLSRRLVSETLLGLEADPGTAEAARSSLRALSKEARPRVREGDALSDRGLSEDGERLDAVLGNPPWLREKDGAAELAAARKTSLGRRFSTGKMDLWYLFAHAALEALPEGGRHGFVVPAYWFDAASARKLRAALAETRLELVVDLGRKRWFPEVSARCALYVCEKGKPLEATERIDMDDEPVRWEGPAFREDGTIARREDGRAGLVEKNGVVALELEVAEGVTPGPEAWTDAVARRAALAAGISREELEAARGIRRGEGVFVVEATNAPEALPWAGASDVPSFPFVPATTRSILYVTKTASAEALAHLEKFRPALERRRETLLGRRPWFALHWPRSRGLFSGPRVLFPRMTATPRATFVEGDLVTGESVLVLRFPGEPRKTRLAAALLETEPLAAWLLGRSKKRGVGIDVSVAIARRIPWPRALVEGDLERVEPVAQALERGDRDEASRLAWALYETP